MTLLIGQLELPDYIVLVGYFALMLGIGAYFYRYMRAMKDYFSGGNRIPWWLSGVSFYMSSFSVAAFVQYSALAYRYGWVSVTLYWVTVPAILVSAIFFARRWRRARIESPVEYLEERYGPSVRQVFAWQGIPVTVIDDALKLVAIGSLFLSPVLGWPANVSIVVAGTIMLLYTLLGGLWAVMVTDFLQFVVQTAAIVVLLPLAIQKVGGFASFVTNAPEKFFHFTQPEYNWVYILSNVVLFTLALSVRWSLIQRYYCVPRERDATRVGGMVVVMSIISPPLMFLPAMAAAEFLPGLDKHIYAQVCTTLLPVGMLGLLIAAMFSATMSMLSSDFNVCASVLTNDVYRRLVRPSASQRELVMAGRTMTLLVGLTALAIALVIGDIGGEDLFRNMVKLFSLAVAPVAIPMLAGLLSRRVTETAALAGFIGGMATGLLLFVACPDTINLAGLCVKKENLILASTIVVTLTYVIIVSWRDTLLSAERRRVEAFHGRLSSSIGTLSEDLPGEADGRGKTFSPFKVVGICTLLIGALVLAVLPFIRGSAALPLNLGVGLGLLAVGGIMALASVRHRDAGEPEEST